MQAGKSPRSPGASDGDGPIISVDITPHRLKVVGRRFLPGRGVIVRLIDAEDTTNYFQYTADLFGELIAVLPPSIPHGTLRISATDSRPDPGDETGLRWTHTVAISW